MTMVAVPRILTPRSFHGRVFLYLIIITWLGMQIRLLTLLTKLLYSSHSITVFQTFSDKRNTNATIVELLHNISRQVKVVGVDCAAIFKGSENDTAAAKNVIGNVSSPLSDLFYINLTQDCENFQKQRGYVMSPLTDEEEQFPIAYSMLVYKDSEMVERLLRAIYRPQNVYCIHVDQKASNDFFEAISSVAKCFPNVFLVSRRIPVVWAKFTVLEPEIVCMEDLWKFRKWKYFINLTGQEFPLKTNHELVKILILFKGAVDVPSSRKGIKRPRIYKSQPPLGLLIVKGTAHVVVNREFVDFILHNKTAKELLNWTKTTVIPDERFFGMLNSNPRLGIKGTYKGDLPRLGESPMMFANKFFLEEDRVVIGCLEEKIFNDTRDEYMGTKVFNTTPYENLAIVRNKVE